MTVETLRTIATSDPPLGHTRALIHRDRISNFEGGRSTCEERRVSGWNWLDVKRSPHRHRPATHAGTRRACATAEPTTAEVGGHSESQSWQVSAEAVNTKRHKARECSMPNAKC